jgi:hypothetical protein
VGTQNIRNNQSRVGGLDHVAATGTIIEAVDSQPWSGEANVHVSIVNWMKTQDADVVPKKRRLWSKVAPSPAGRGQGEGASRRRSGSPSASSPSPGTPGEGRGEGRADKTYELQVRECAAINPALSDQIDVTQAVSLRCATEPQQVFQGQNPANEDFMLAPDEAERLFARNANLREVIFPYMIGRDLVADGKPSRRVIDFAKRDMLAASAFPEAFAHVKERIMPTVLARAEAERKATGEESTRWTRMAERWWQFRDYQPGTMRAIASVPRYIVCSRTTKRPIFAFVSNQIHPDTKLMVFPFADDYSFGILQSGAHWLWFVTKCSKLKSDFAYTPSSVWDTFPWPQSPTKAQIDAVAEAGRQIRRIRAAALADMKGGLRALYRTLELPGRNPLKDAHAALDAAVLAAYGFDPKADLLAQLLALNLAVSTSERLNRPVTAPGVPISYGDAASLITDDCIRP